MRPTPRFATGWVLLSLFLLPALFSGVADARHTPMVGGAVLPDGTALAAGPGMSYEVDRRSHPVLTEGWDAVLRPRTPTGVWVIFQAIEQASPGSALNDTLRGLALFLRLRL